MIHQEIYTWEEIRFHLKTAPLCDHSLELHVMRHAQTVNNSKNLVTGGLDIDLTEHGKQQARKSAIYLNDYYDVIVTSSLKRTIETATIAINEKKIKYRYMIRDSRLNERSLGFFEGKDKTILPTFVKTDFDYASEKLESYREVSRRIMSFLISLIESCAKEGLSSVLLCTHMGAIRVLNGILNDFSDVSNVTQSNFKNAEVLKFNLKQLSYPAFLDF
jgi:broad specificity phosphatase PhoE